MLRVIFFHLKCSCSWSEAAWGRKAPCSTPSHPAAVWRGLSGVGALVGLGQTAARHQKKMLPSPGTKIKSEDICDSSNFYIIGCRGLNSSRKWIQPDNVWLGGHQWRSAPGPALRWSSAQKLKLLAACIDLIPCRERQTISKCRRCLWNHKLWWGSRDKYILWDPFPLFFFLYKAKF